MAGNRIKGITVEIGGDTTKLQTALKGVNTEIRNTQSQLKDVEKLLKLDPGNTELIAQQQADEALRNGTISQDQYDALQREIVETEQRLRSLEEQANQSATALQKIGATGEKQDFFRGTETASSDGSGDRAWNSGGENCR